MKIKNLSDKSINCPGSKYTLQYINYQCAAATPPSKGGKVLFSPPGDPGEGTI